MLLCAWSLDDYSACCCFCCNFCCYFVATVVFVVGVDGGVVDVIVHGVGVIGGCVFVLVLIFNFKCSNLF